MSASDANDGTTRPSILRAPSGLSSRIMLSIGLLPVLPAIVLSVLSFFQVRQTTMSELEHHGEAVASSFNYAVEALLEQQSAHVLQRVVSNSAMIPNVRALRIADRQKAVIASSERSEVGTERRSPYLDKFFADSGARPVVAVGDQNELIVVRPLYRGAISGATDKGVIGAIELTLDRRDAEAAAYAAAYRMLGSSLGVYFVVAAITVVVLRGLVVRPLHQLASVARAFRDGDRAQRSGIRRNDEIGFLAASFDDMAQEVEAIMAKLEEQVAARTAALEERTRALDELQASTAERIRLAEAVRELSTPVIRVHRDILVMPLIGAIDARRAEQIQTSLLQGIEQHAARMVILDLTGVPIVDAEVAACLMRAKRSAELLGSTVIMAGMSASVARSIVDLEIEFSGVVSCTNLESGLRLALQGLAEGAGKRLSART